MKICFFLFGRGCGGVDGLFTEKSDYYEVGFVFGFCVGLLIGRGWMFINFLGVFFWCLRVIFDLDKVCVNCVIFTER